MSVHGDDFTVTGPDEELLDLENLMQAKYEIKSEHFGPDAHQQQEIRVLNRTIRWTAGGIEYEPDQMHSEIIINEMGHGRDQALGQSRRRRDARRSQVDGCVF